MSLDTVIKIGKALKGAENNLKYFKYVAHCERDRDGNYPIFLTIPVSEDFVFDWKDIRVTPEVEREELFYLVFTTSNNDSSPKKYGFGDIYYARKTEIDKSGKIKGVKDFGNFTFEKGKNQNSFLNGKEQFNEIKNTYLKEFLSTQLHEIKNEANRNEISKAILQAFQTGKVLKLNKKILQYKNISNELLQKLQDECNKIELFKFQASFENEINRFNLLIKYAPVFEYILETDKSGILKYLDSRELTENKYVEFLLQKQYNQVKRLFKKDEKAESLYEETIELLKQFFDFSVFLHFEFSSTNHWYQFDKSFNLIKSKLNSEILDDTEKGLVPSKSIYRTLCSGDDKNDIQFPLFKRENKYKSFAFKSDSEFDNFLYADVIINRPFIRLQGTSIEMFVFPTFLDIEEEIKAKDYDDFFFTKKDELKVGTEPLFPPFIENTADKIKRFDFVFSDSSGNTINDLIEISGIEKSRLRQIKERRDEIASEIFQLRKKYFKTDKDLPTFNITNSLKNILGNVEADSKTGNIRIKPNAKYQSHLLKVLPLMYTENYYQDEMLLNSFVQNTQTTIRAGDSKFNFLKYDLMFLLKFQNSTDNYMALTESLSYQIGLKMGKLAKPIGNRINSFEKSYVGLLTRRVSTHSDCIAFLNEIDEMLIRQGIKWLKPLSAEIHGELTSISLKEYDKDKLAFGFFEGYFKYEPIDKKKDFFNRLEKLLADYQGNSDLENELQQLSELTESMRTE